MGGHHHSFAFDPYTRVASPIQRLPAGLKLAAALAVVLTIVTIPRSGHAVRVVLPAVVLLLSAVTGLSRVPAASILKRIVLLEPVVLGAAMLTLLQPGGGGIFLALILRSTLCIWTTILLSSTTPFDDLLAALRFVRVPGLLISTMAMMYRYLAVLVDQSQRMRRARAARSFTPGTARDWRGLATLVGQLFVRTAERSERVYNAMCARGWQ